MNFSPLTINAKENTTGKAQNTVKCKILVEVIHKSGLPRNGPSKVTDQSLLLASSMMGSRQKLRHRLRVQQPNWLGSQPNDAIPIASFPHLPELDSAQMSLDCDLWRVDYHEFAMCRRNGEKRIHYFRDLKRQWHHGLVVEHVDS